MQINRISGYRRVRISLILVAMILAIFLASALPYQLEVTKNGGISISLQTAQGQDTSYIGLDAGDDTYLESAGILNGMRFLADLSPLLEPRAHMTLAADAPAAVYDGEDETFTVMGSVKIENDRGETFQCTKAVISLEDDTIDLEGPGSGRFMIEEEAAPAQ